MTLVFHVKNFCTNIRAIFFCTSEEIWTVETFQNAIFLSAPFFFYWHPPGKQNQTMKHSWAASKFGAKFHLGPKEAKILQ